MSQKVESLDIYKLLLIVKRHFMLLIIIPVICGLMGYCVTQWAITPQYKSDAFLIVNAAQSSQTTSITYDQITAAQQLVTTYSFILKSDTVLNQVIDNLNLDTDAKKLAKSITVNGVDQTEVIDITVHDPDSQRAADIANEIIRIAPTIIIDTVKTGSIEIISPAKKTDKPVSPNKTLNTAIALLGGLIVAVVISLLLEMMNNTFDSSEDMQKYLKYPVLGVIPNIKNKQYRLR